MDTTYREYVAGPPLRQPYTRNEKELAALVLTEAFAASMASQWRGRAPPPTLNDLRGHYESFCSKYFPLDTVSREAFVRFVEKEHKPAVRLFQVHNQAWWNKTPSGQSYGTFEKVDPTSPTTDLPTDMHLRAPYFPPRP